MTTKAKINSDDDDRQITPHSRRSDPVWVFDNDAPGQRERDSQIDWRELVYGEGCNLYDDGPASLLEELQAFVEIAYAAANEDNALAAGSLFGTQSALCVLTQWLASEHIESIADVDEEVSWTLIDWLESCYEEEGEFQNGGGRPRELTHSSAWRPINLLLQLYERRAGLRKLGVGCMTERPFGPDSTALSVVTETMGLKREGRLHPLPDAIALPLLKQAVRMISEPADDVLDLQDLMLRLMEGDYRESEGGYRRSNEEIVEAAQSFDFRSCAGETAPWRGPIEDVVSRTMIDGRMVELTVLQQVRRLIITVVQACVVVLQGLTGMRASELIGLEAKVFDDAGTPECLQTRLTADGSFELFELHGKVVKGRKQKTYWVIGARPAGSTYEPPTVRAVRVLGRLLSPWRSLGGRTTLLVTFSAARGLPRSESSVGGVYSTTITQWQREFCFEYLDNSTVEGSVVGGKSAYSQIRGHRWRPTFAVHVYRTDPRLVLAVADHFKHLSEVMTEQGYIGNDPAFLDAMDAARVQTVAMMLLQLTSGSAPAAGPAAKLVEKYRAELRQQMSDDDGEGSVAHAQAERFVRVNGLQIYNGQHGACLMAIMPMESRCRQMSGTQSWRNTVPDTSVRTPAVCAGCQCYLVRVEHLPYWRRAVEEHRQVLNAAQNEDQRRELRVSKNRLSLAEAIVEKLERMSNAGGQPSGQS